MTPSTPHDDTDQIHERFTELAGTIRQGGTIGQMLNITPDECEALYTVGHNLYQQARYSEAFKVFSRLVMYDHLNDRYLMALAGAAQLLERYEDALHNYATVTLMRLDDPTPIFHSAECLIAMSRLDEAVETLELILEMDPEPDSTNTITQRTRDLLPLLRTRAREHHANAPKTP